MLTSSPPPPEITVALDRGERVLWSGQPRQGLTLRGSDAYLIPFSLIWCGFVVFWESMVVYSGGPLFARLWGIPFVLAGIYFVFGRFFVDAAQRRRTYYAVTNDRILIASGLRSRSTRSLALRTLDQVDLSARSSGEGTIMFGRSPYGSFAIPGWPSMGKTLPPMFELISDAAKIAKLIRDAQRAATAEHA
jgi:hypothetical protein